MGKISGHIPARLGIKLNKIRNDLELTQSEMLDLIKKRLPELARDGLFTFNEKSAEGLFRTSISAYERGKRMPPYNVLIAYAELANVYLEVLVNDMVDLPNEKIPLRNKGAGTKLLFY